MAAGVEHLAGEQWTTPPLGYQNRPPPPSGGGAASKNKQRERLGRRERDT
ncbi:hypothetical protein Hanom_Chr05g00396041 [Helianthus anomalus]